MGFHGNPWIRTPHMDRLAGESFRFTDFHVGTTCAPTRSGLMTGRNCNRVGVWHTVMGRSLLRKDEITLARVFRENGYRTGMFGKWHLGDNYPYRPMDRGFEEAFYHGGGGITQGPDYWDNDYFDDTYFRNGKPEKASGYCTDVWFSNALDFIEKNRDEPFFCYLSTNAPHGPFHVPLEYLEIYRDCVDVVNPNFYGMITNIDDNLGHFRNWLEELGLAHNTILIFMTDNGAAAGVDLDGNGFLNKGYNAGMRGKKGSEYNGGHRVPLFMHWKDGKIDRGSDITRITSYTDLMPTLIDLCRLKAPAIEYNGTSLRPLIYLNGEDWPERVIITDTQREDTPVKWKQCAIMTGRWHLVLGEELYDMTSDPGQTEDVSVAHPGIVEELRQAYEAWWEDISVDFADYCEIIIDPAVEDPFCLHSHDCHTDDPPPWNQEQIRLGKVDNGFWVLDVAEAGSYRFDLRRWPIETALPLNAAVATGEPVPGGDPQPPGVSLHFVKATARAGQVEKSRPVDPSSEAVSFEFDLQPGEFRFQTWLEDTEGVTRGAYYVYVYRVG